MLCNELRGAGNADNGSFTLHLVNKYKIEDTRPLPKASCTRRGITTAHPRKGTIRDSVTPALTQSFKKRQKILAQSTLELSKNKLHKMCRRLEY